MIKYHFHMLKTTISNAELFQFLILNDWLNNIVSQHVIGDQ
jgi:hypothetical protein